MKTWILATVLSMGMGASWGATELQTLPQIAEIAQKNRENYQTWESLQYSYTNKIHVLVPATAGNASQIRIVTKKGQVTIKGADRLRIEETVVQNSYLANIYVERGNHAELMTIDNSRNREIQSGTKDGHQVRKIGIPIWEIPDSGNSIILDRLDAVKDGTITEVKEETIQGHRHIVVTITQLVPKDMSSKLPAGIDHSRKIIDYDSAEGFLPVKTQIRCYQGENLVPAPAVDILVAEYRQFEVGGKTIRIPITIVSQGVRKGIKDTFVEQSIDPESIKFNVPLTDDSFAIKRNPSDTIIEVDKTGATTMPTTQP